MYLIRYFIFHLFDSIFQPCVRILKLDLLASLATEANISLILSEFHTYCKDSDKKFVAAAIQAIGRCATVLPQVSESCMRGLVSLIHNNGHLEVVVAQAVLVIRQLLQTNSELHNKVIPTIVYFYILVVIYFSGKIDRCHEARRRKSSDNMDNRRI